MLHHNVNIPEIPPLVQTPPVEEATTNEIQEARKVDNHSKEVKETNGQDRSVSQIIDKMLEGLDISCIKSTTIFKVQVELRESNPDAYIPKMISIGPYHKKNDKLRSMEKYKLLYLQRFLKRKEPEIKVESCIKELEKLKDEALKCYDDVEYNTDQFLQMLLLDGCFVVEFIRERCRMSLSGEDLIFNGEYMYLLRDLLLLENQLPFFVLTMLHQMTMGKDEVSLINLVKLLLQFHLVEWIHPVKSETEDNEKDINHLLQIVHYMLCQPLERKNSEASSWEMMPNATKLSEAGVRFSKDENRHKSSLLEIKFTNGLMKIPCLVVDDHTEAILRNLIAYEQQSSGIKLQYFSDYVAFMDILIDSEKDVALLREKGIISNMLGENKEVADMFNKIGKGVINSRYDFYYQEECRKATHHYRENRWKSKKTLRDSYFNNPWAAISTVAAIILLLLTVTVLAFISFFK